MEIIKLQLCANNSKSGDSEKVNYTTIKRRKRERERERVGQTETKECERAKPQTGMRSGNACSMLGCSFGF